MGLSAAAAVFPALRTPFSFTSSSASAVSSAGIVVGLFGKCWSGGGRSSGASSAFPAAAATLVGDSNEALNRRWCWNYLKQAKNPASVMSLSVGAGEITPFRGTGVLSLRAAEGRIGRSAGVRHRRLCFRISHCCTAGSDWLAFEDIGGLWNPICSSSGPCTAYKCTLSPVTRSTFRALATMSSKLSESAGNNPGLHETPDEATKGYFVQQTMYRIKDPKVSLDFYTRILGMSLLKRFDFPEAKFSLYFLGYEDIASAPTDPQERVAWTFGKRATIELTHNWGTESDENFKGHHNGNSDPRGYGHIGITVDDTYKACERFEKLGVNFVKKPDDGKMKGLAFIQDPDGYWIEIFDVQGMSSITPKS